MTTYLMCVDVVGKMDEGIARMMMKQEKKKKRKKLGGREEILVSIIYFPSRLQLPCSCPVLVISM